MAAAQTDIALIVGDRPLGRAERFTGSAVVSGAYRFDVAVFCDTRPADPEAVLGGAARIDIGHSSQPTRYIHGILAEWDVAATAEGWRVRAAVVPRAWLLDQHPRTRTFRELSAVDVALALTGKLCSDGGSYVRAEGKRHPKARAMTQQGGETDLGLIGRMLAEAGMAYVFVQAHDGERLLLVDRVAQLARAVGAPRADVAARACAGLVRHGRLAVDAEGRSVPRAAWRGEIDGPGLVPGMRLAGAGHDGSDLYIAAVTHDAEWQGAGWRDTCRFEAVPPDQLVPEAAAPADVEVRQPARWETAVNEAPVPRHMAPGDVRAPSAYGHADTQVSDVPDASGGNSGAKDGKSLNFLVPDFYNATSDAWSAPKSTYLRLGAANLGSSSGAEAMYSDAESGAVDQGDGLNIEGSENTRHKLDGWFDYTGGNHVSITMGNKEELINGKRRLQINGGGPGVWDIGPQYFLDVSPRFTPEDAESDYFWDQAFPGPNAYKTTVANQSSKAEFTWGDNQTIALGLEFGLFSGFSASTSLSGNFNFGVNADVNVNFGPSIDFGYTSNVDLTGGSSYGLSKSHSTEAHNAVTLGVLNTALSGGAERADHKKWFAGLQAGIGATAAGLAGGLQGAGVAGVTSEVDNAGAKQFRESVEALQYASLSMWGAGMAQYAAYLIRAKSREKSSKPYASIVRLAKSGTKMEVNNTAGMPFGSVSTELSGDAVLANMGGKTMLMDAPAYFQAASDGTAFVSAKSGVTMKTQNGQCVLELSPNGTTSLTTKQWNQTAKKFDVNQGALKVI